MITLDRPREAELTAEPVALDSDLDLPDMVEVTVTEDDIALGIPGNSRLCPVASALKRQFSLNRFADVGVGLGLCSFVCETSTGFLAQKTYVLSESAQIFISDFDRRRPVQPITFMMWSAV